MEPYSASEYRIARHWLRPKMVMSQMTIVDGKGVKHTVGSPEKSLPVVGGALSTKLAVFSRDLRSVDHQ